MKNYGQVKGRKYYGVQVEAECRDGKKKCPTCGKYKPEDEYVGSDKLPKKNCKQCRFHMTRARYLK